MTRTAPRPHTVAEPTRRSRGRVPIVRLPRPPLERTTPTWRQADPDRIAAALADAESRDPGGWCVAAASAAIPTGRSVVLPVAGREVVFWRTADGRLCAGPGACPHLGAALDACPVTGSTIHCRWHGLAFTPTGGVDWSPYPSHDDGLLVWVRLPGIDASVAPAPVPSDRPPAQRSVSAVIEVRGRCEPRDVIANRLDPWHGSWFHPYAFSHLTVDDAASTERELVVDVVFRLGRTFGVPVRAVFSCPDARTICMHVVDGEGAGSVVETHATPIGLDDHGAPVTQVTELTMAHSARGGFRVAARVAPLIRPMMRRTARRLWVDDLAYAERRFRVRSGELA